MSAPWARVTAGKFLRFLKDSRVIQSKISRRPTSQALVHRYTSNYSKYQGIWTGKWLRIGALCGGSVLTALLVSKSPLQEKFNLDSLLPQVHAAVAKDGESPRQRFNFIADIVEKAAPAVVHVEILGRHPFTGQMIPVSNGSGFIIREDGLILSNAHVVANKVKVVIQLKDGRRFDGDVQAVDAVSDLATIKIKAHDLPTLKLGNSEDLKPGEWVIAMGSPLTLNDTVTAGIVSTPHRGLNLGRQKADIKYIQTDAVITHGNSGGPLVNLDGEAIGINTMKLTTGISFAIPSDYARGFVDRAFELEQRTTRRKWFSDSPRKRHYIGINMLTLQPSIIQELKRFGVDFPADVTTGVLVNDVHAQSPAFNAGIQPGDVITSINGETVTSSRDVYNAVSSSSELRVTLQRGRSKLSVIITPEEVS